MRLAPQSGARELLVNAGVIIKTLGPAAGLLAGGISRKIMERRNDGRRRSMTITLPLEPQEEARLKAAAQAKGLSPDAFVREVLDKILAEAAAEPAKPKKSAYGLLAKYGPGPTEEEIDENRREMFRGFGRTFRDRRRCRYTHGLMVSVQEFASVGYRADLHG